MDHRPANFLYLLLGLLLLLFTIPTAEQLGLAGTPAVSLATFSILLIVGVLSLRGGGRYFSVGLVFVTAGVGFNTAASLLRMPALDYGVLLSLIGFLVVASAFTLRRVLFGTRADPARLVGAFCVFLMLGVIWAFAYTLMELYSPGSFNGITDDGQGGWDSGWLYFSFVTLTTLGYGDISPATPVARTFAYLQAVVGQFYLAVLVAGLVSAYMAEHQDDP